MAPRDVVIVDQYFDRTKKGLEHTFFGGGIVAHTAFAHPVCPELAELAAKAAETALKKVSGAQPKVHRGGTYVNMEGPAFSTKAESKTYKANGFDVIGMTNLGEAKLAREAEICYTTVAMVTDYDCWHPEHDHVTVEMIIANFSANVSVSKDIIREAVRLHSSLPGKCHCRSALAGAIITKPEAVSNELRTKLAPIIGRYLPAK
jgi:5'-methylthioadenosine phosphorylase